MPFTAVGSELLFEVFSQRDERGATLVTSNLPFDEWTSIYGSERLTGALLVRLTHYVHILEMNGDNFRLATSKRVQRRQGQVLNTTPKNSGRSRHRCMMRPRVVSRASPGPTRLTTRGTIVNQGFAARYLLTRLVPFYAAIWHNLSPPLTVAGRGFLPRRKMSPRKPKSVQEKT